MAHFLGLGLTHYPLLAGTDEHMASLLRWTLTDPDIPAAEKDPANWPAAMRDEWGNDQGVAAAAHHRKLLVENLARCRNALDEFNPDVVVVWGDDQYENFREEIIPPFCVLAYGDVEAEPFELMTERGSPNAWGLPNDTTITLHGAPENARQLTTSLIERGFDMAYSYEKRKDSAFPHAIINTQLFLDYPNAGATFPYPLIPITVNCYGPHVIARRGGLVRFADIRKERTDPVGPSPARCFALGRAVAQSFAGTNLRVALVASSSWSHAFLVDKNWHITPDTDADLRLYELLKNGDYAKWQSTSAQDLIESGQQELLNWFCMTGAVAELGLELAWSDFVATDVFNSNKCFGVFKEGNQG
ncbi:extradiol ring-cleavage dioxygenase class III protein subunit B [Mycobacterium rhizamassiliense]|uniref:Extradiol ring-cleavage dioxygenase class III protein subunit B n=2 Tax=Mycobacterium TaxID=1763 RepID=A0A2U3PA77_9MYCO|nr:MULTISPECIES: extradiol ring-cleavage dioxygenase [Mycobacterium]SPM34841.1 extradiol ring-cleavage dioxygenase class III protein subunit B [Mycobacterium rhizamassiliense]SPM40668.1 extradiol ring-cleavage dioxygenase class III protein subunit B [Mycobacterium numidiamassiliense]